MKDFIAIMPMAGKGKRFSQYGVKDPKPFIKIKNKPMFVKAASSFPKSVEWIFVLQKKFKINKFIKKNLNMFKYKKIFYLNKYTSGQASTVSKVINFVNKTKAIIIHSCDLQFKIEKKKIKKKINNYDVIVFTAKPTKFNLQNSKQFSWVFKNSNNNLEISLKKKIENKNFKSKVLVGTFIFKNRKVLKNCLKYIFKNNLKIGNEFYIDYAAKISKKIGYKLGEIPIKNYISWGSYKEFKNIN